MPQRQIVMRRVGAEQCRRRHFQKTFDRLSGKNADQHAHHDQQRTGQQHPVCRIVRRMRQISGLRPKKHIVDEAQRIGNAEHAGKRCKKRQNDAHPSHLVKIDGFCKKHFLRQETIEQGHARHRRGRNHRQRRRDRHDASKAGQAPDIARTGFVINDAGGHEQRGLERRVIDHVKNCGNQRQRAVHAKQQGNQPEMADRRISQNALQIILEHGQITGDDQRAQAGAAHHPEPLIRTGQQRPQPRQQKDPRLDHRGRMQIGGNRRRRSHRMRQPEMKGKLCAFGQRPQRYQGNDRGIPGMVFDHVGRRQYSIKIIAADDTANQQYATE